LVLNFSAISAPSAVYLKHFFPAENKEIAENFFIRGFSKTHFSVAPAEAGVQEGLKNTGFWLWPE
jgi:hypothetical protein